MTTTTDALTVHFLRHGETAGSAERRFQVPGTPLSARGREQATAVAATLAGSTRAGAIIASDYQRTVETAAIIAERLQLPVSYDAALRERNFGIVRGRLYADVGEEELARFRDVRYRIQEGESWADVYERMAVFLDRLRGEPPARELILVTHGGAMSIALGYLAGIPIDGWELTPLENCAVRTLVLATAGGG